MSTLVEVPVEGGSVHFDIEETPVGRERISRRGGNIVVELDERLEDALASIRPAAEAVLDVFKAVAPDEVQVEFGLRLDAEAGVVIARAGVSGHFTVNLTWSRSDKV